MKKLIALLLAICMVTFSSCSTTTDVQETTSSKISTTETLNVDVTTTTAVATTGTSVAYSKLDMLKETESSELYSDPKPDTQKEVESSELHSDSKPDTEQKNEESDLKSNGEEVITPSHNSDSKYDYEPLNSNFKKVLDFSESGIDLDEIGIEEQYREDFIRLYELGFSELRNLPYMPDELACACMFKLFLIYCGGILPEIPEGEPYYLDIAEDCYAFQSYEITLWYAGLNNLFLPSDYWINMATLRVECDEDWLYTEDSEYTQAETLLRGRRLYDVVGVGTFCNQQMQILITRLFDIMDLGEPINSLQSIVDVPASSDPDRIDASAVLKLFNMGIYTGDEYGRFNAYGTVTPSEFVAILARICYPNRRVKIDVAEYNKNASKKLEEIQTYNDITPETYDKVMAYTNLKALYPFEQSADRSIAWDEAIYVACRLARGELAGQTDVTVSTISEEEVYNSISRYGTSLSDISPLISKADLTMGIHSNYNRIRCCTADKLNSDIDIAGKENISKLDAAILLYNIARDILDFDFGSFELNVSLNEDIMKGKTKRQNQLYSEIVTLGLLENTVQDFTQESITEAEFEKMLVQFVIQFSDYLPYGESK